MSALPPKGDICSALPNVRFGPIADIRAAKSRVHSKATFVGSEWNALSLLALHWGSHAKSAIARSIYGATLPRVRLWPLMETYGDTVPGVHKRDGISNVGNLLTVVMSRQWLIRRVGSMRDVDVGEDLRPLQRSLLRLGEVRAFPPSGEAIEAFIGFASLSQVARMHINAV